MMFVFIILNFNSAKETIECIESINNLSYQDRKIVVVDNASNEMNNSLAYIKDHCRNINGVSYIQSKKNVGYARGNNIGIYFAKKYLKADFICVINPDIRIKSRDFAEEIIKAYKRNKFAVLGPQIVDENGNNLNPLGGFNPSKIASIKAVIRTYKIYFVKKYNISISRWKKISHKINTKNESSVKKACAQSSHYIEENSNQQLHGSCICFTPLFLKSYNGFYKGTFLYVEEAILTLCCHNLGLPMYYCNEIAVVHSGGKSVKTQVDSERERWIFTQRHGGWSCICFLWVSMHLHNSKYLKMALTPDVDKNMFKVI